MKRIEQLGKELDKVELETIKTIPLPELLITIQKIILLALQIIKVLSVFFSKERKEKIKVAIQRLKAET